MLKQELLLKILKQMTFQCKQWVAYENIINGRQKSKHYRNIEEEKTLP